jgi:RNA polymerase-binding protein DksA
MSLTAHFPLAGNVLLPTSDVREQQRELVHAIDRAQIEIRALADSESGDVVDDYSGSASREAIFPSYSESRTKLRKVELALQRLSAGDFGICADCRGAIGLKRLKALPCTNNCIECQEQSEQARVN